jgi:hypothetical protein
LLRIDGCRGLFQNFTFNSNVYLRSPGPVAGLSLPLPGSIHEMHLLRGHWMGL